jgi:hypothetical protein
VKAAPEIRHQAELRRKQLHERGRTRGKHDVPDEREAHSGARGDTVHRNHHGNSQVVPRVHHGIEMLAHARADELAQSAPGCVDEILAHEIGARAEGATGRSQQHGA